MPDQFPGASLLTIVMNNIPDVSPFNMDTTGPIAYETARAAMSSALVNGSMQQVAYNHWVLHIDGSSFIAAATGGLADFPVSNNNSDGHNNNNSNISRNNNTGNKNNDTNLKTTRPR